MLFQERHKWLYRSFTLFGIYPPGIENILPASLCRIAFTYYLVGPMVAFIHLAGMAYFLLTEKLSTYMFALYLRRSVILIYLSSKFFFSIIQRKKFEKLFYLWNEESPLDFDKEKREVILQEKINNSYKLLVVGFLLEGVFPQMYAVLHIINPYNSLAATTWYPHSFDSPNHFLFIFLHSYMYLHLAIGSFALESVYLHALFMLSTRLRILKENLSKIVQLVKIKNDCTIEERKSKGNKFISKEFQKWIIAHQLTMRWAKELKQTFAYDISIKYFCVGVYSCLVAFSAHIWLAQSNFAELVIILFFAFGVFFMQFVLTKAIDNICEESHRLFEEAFSKQWYAHSVIFQKSLHIICTYTNVKPIKFYAFGIFQDNSEFFKLMLVIAYRFLTVLLQMPNES